MKSLPSTDVAAAASSVIQGLVNRLTERLENQSLIKALVLDMVWKPAEGKKANTVNAGACLESIKDARKRGFRVLAHSYDFGNWFSLHMPDITKEEAEALGVTLSSRERAHLSFEQPYSVHMTDDFFKLGKPLDNQLLDLRTVAVAHISIDIELTLKMLSLAKSDKMKKHISYLAESINEFRDMLGDCQPLSKLYYTVSERLWDELNNQVREHDSHD